MSDFNYRGKLPFRIISSSVNTGYNAELTAAVGRNIEVVDQHTDHYASLQDSPMQGPFTETWVGGNQHRHTDLNDGTDDASNRPEAFLISGSSNKVRVYGPAHFDEMAPKAVLTREEVAKRPLNIKNIATVDGKLGNFSHNYEVVQTSGRDINQSLIVNNLTASGVLTTKFINFTSPAVATIPAIAVNGDFQFLAIPIGLDSGNSLRVELLFGQPTAQITEVGFDVTVSLTSSGWTNWDVGDFIAITSNWVSGIPKFYDTYFYDETATSAFSFIDFGSGTDGIASITVGEYTLPDLTNDRNRTVFVERFSAPGDKKESSRGALDRESEQYSPNNSLTTRNISVRQTFNSQLTQHSAQFGSGSIEGVSTHKVNRNTSFGVELSGATFVTASDYDNFHIQHSIPRTDLRYKWITDSYVPSLTSPFFEYQRIGTDSEEIIFNSSSFVISGSNKRFAVDNIGINSLIKDKKSIDLTTNFFSVSSSVKLSASFSEIANTPYGYSTWKQIRTGEHPVARKLRENNILSLEGVKSKIINGTQTTSKRSENVKNYIEPPVTSKFKPLKQTLELKGSNEKYEFTFTHNNNLSTFVSDEVLDYLGIRENRQQTYDLLKKYYSDPNRATNAQNPVSNLKEYTYSETLYPREVNAYIAETRARTQYILDQAGTASRDGYDIQLGTQRAFWRDRLEDRMRSSFVSLNSLNYNNDLSLEEQILYKPSSIELPGYGTYDGREWLNITNSLYPHSFGPNNSIHSFDNCLQTQILYGFNDLKLDGLFINSSSIFDTGSLQITNTIVTNLGTGELNREIFLDYFASCSVDYTSSLDDNSPTFLKGTKKQLTRVTPHSVLLQHIPDLEQLHILDPKEVFPDYYPSYASMSQSLPQPRPNYVAFIGGFESGSRSYGISDPQTIEEYEVYNTQPTGPILSTLDSGLRYCTESFGDKKPWFDTYEDYIDDIRPLAKDHSIIPEFRISSNMPYYVTSKGGNFRSPNKAFLEIDGIGQNYRSAAIPQILTYNQNFINSYVTTDTADYITKLESDNRPVTKPESIKFTISGIKKLLPYNGFYPQERTIQLANLFNDFLEQNVGGGYFSLFKTIQSSSAGAGDAINALIYNSDNSGSYWSKNTIMPYFFSPGILFNTIKSGISVDFPAMTASIADIQNSTNNPLNTDQLTVTELNLFDKCSMLSLQYGVFDDLESENSPSNRIDPYEFEASYLPKNKINSRVPFESIIFPQSFITKPSYVTSSFAYTSTHDITVTASKDLELEGIYSKYISNSVLNIKFDCNHQPDRYHQPLYGFGLLFAAQPDFINLGYYQKNSVPFCYLRDDTVIDPSYSMAMSNFLAEIPTFFLKQQSADRDQHLNVFRSSELRDWKPFQIGKKYYLDIKMKKSSDLVMMEAYRSEYHVTGNNAIEKTFNGRYFGWPVDKVSGSRTVQDNYVVHNDPAYAPFTPPYFEGEAILRFELSAASASYNTVGELFKDLRLTDIFNELGQSAHTASEAYLNKMSIQDCMEVFGIGANPVPTFEANGTARSQDATPNTQTQYWAISPKLETPVLDFSDQEFVAHTGSYWVSSGYGRGMWSGYGKIPTGSKGITIEMAESFPLQNSGRFNNFTNSVNPKLTGSLLDQVGFKAQSSKIGQLAETKDISEAIVAIPYVDKPITGVTTFVDGHHFITINENIYRNFKNSIDNNSPLIILGQSQDYDNSIAKMIIAMDKYVIPPNLNFSKYTNIDPFVMYFFEFKHTLDQQDLADIWQGVMPKIAYKAEEDQVVIEHKFGPHELFGGNYSTPENLRWMIFKVKKKAEWNYFAITENIGDDDRFKFNFANGEVAQTPDYSYNWPYDYFSLVELAKVDIALTYDEKPQTSGSTNIDINQFAIGNRIDFSDI